VLAKVLEGLKFFRPGQCFSDDLKPDMPTVAARTHSGRDAPLFGTQLFIDHLAK
jgi:hypothetical protein